MKRSYLVVYEKGRKNYSGFAPDLPGCASAGETLDEMRSNMKQAIEGWMEVSSEYGDSVPEATTTSVTLPIEGELDPKTTYVVEFQTVTLPRPAKAKAKRTPQTKRAIHRSRELVAA